MISIINWVAASAFKNGGLKAPYTQAKLHLLGLSVNEQPDAQGWVLVGNIDKTFCEILGKPYTGPEVDYCVNIQTSLPHILQWKIKTK